jgi:hypothetical protein
VYELSLFLVYVWKNFDKTRIIKENQVRRVNNEL